MITGVDTNILLDVLLPDEVHGPPSAELLRVAYDRDRLALPMAWRRAPPAMMLTGLANEPGCGRCLYI